jgi:hypothetical protein
MMYHEHKPLVLHKNSKKQAMTKLDRLMHKEMTRRQFLVTLGFGLASLFGLSTLLGALTESDHEKSLHGYGGGQYGH